jgi:predicted O-methyltransferase YrrM
MPDLASNPTDSPAGRGLPAAMAAIEGVEGWLSDEQAARLWQAAQRLGPGQRIVEIGSFRGRSTIVLALGAPPDAEVVAIDPHAGNDRGPQEIRGYEQQAQDDFTVFHANLARAGVDGRVRHVRRFSSDAEADVASPIHLLYIDGAHRFGPARDDLARWGRRVPDGGRLLVHDAFSSVGVTLALLATVLLGRRFRYVGRSGSLVEYEVRAMDARARLRSAADQLAQLPWFLRNLVVKALLVAKRPSWARALGHDGETWPY